MHVLRITAIETGGCPHAAIREDISANLMACEMLTARHQADIILVESGGGTSAFARNVVTTPRQILGTPVENLLFDNVRRNMFVESSLLLLIYLICFLSLKLPPDCSCKKGPH